MLQGRTISRDTLIDLLNKALVLGDARQARQIALSWLAIFPGDLEVSLVYAHSLLKDGQPAQALPVLNRLVQTDPEWLEAAQTRLDAELRLRSQTGKTAKHSSPARQTSRLISIAELTGCVQALGGARQPAGRNMHAKEATSAAWSQQVRQIRQVLARNLNDEPSGNETLEQAELLLSPALAAEISTPLIAATHLHLMRKRAADPQSLANLAEFYHRRWPDCVLFQLILAEGLLVTGETDRAVAFLHRAAANDVAGQVPARLWGDKHPYRSLWPAYLEMRLELQISASLAAAMGWNKLPVGKLAVTNIGPGSILQAPQAKSTPAVPPQSPVQPGIAAQETEQPYVQTASPEALVSIQHELERVAERLNLPGLGRSDGRYPVYVVLTTRRGLEKHYGQAAATQLEKVMQELVRSVQAQRNWHSLLFVADEGLPGQVKPARFNDPWAIKLALADLDRTLSHQGEMIGAVLIAGGPEVVPFHHLPNPVDDLDDDVPSDNPYATRDENYFIPEWPVGRLPGGKSGDPALLQKGLERIAHIHGAQAKHSLKQPWYRHIWKAITKWLKEILPGSSSNHSKASSYGYTAAVWKRTSSIVFRPIGEARALRVSPPIGVSDGGLPALPAARLGYFNLHGLADAAEWYGQGEPVEGAPANENIRDYPVAVRPEHVVNSGRAPEVVFSEACYGGHILNKQVEEALALKFLQAGSQAVVGSTCTAYGSVTAPLTAADLLGHGFWEALRQGLPAGEALRRAKLGLAREMHRRQGYLDGEDQKTLIAFVLYGDPLAQPLPGFASESKTILRPLKPPKGIRTVCDRSLGQDQGEIVPPEVTEYVKKIVAQYLPGMQDARMKICHEHSECDSGQHTCPTKQLHRQKQLLGTQPAPGRSVVVLSKQAPDGVYIHQHYARLTLDEQNRLVKMVVSR